MSVVIIERFACFYEEGVRGLNGGAAKHDKVWGIAVVDNKRCTFWGRRGCKMRFKTMPGHIGRAAAEAIWNEKTGDRSSGDVYTPIIDEAIRNLLVPGLAEQITAYFYSDLAQGKINTRMRPETKRRAA